MFNSKKRLCSVQGPGEGVSIPIGGTRVPTAPGQTSTRDTSNMRCMHKHKYHYVYIGLLHT